jgi:hypothetical protein
VNTEQKDPPKIVENATTAWLRRIHDAEKTFKTVYQRMDDNMRFAAGEQWVGQQGPGGERYMSNMTLRTVNRKTADLYARNPKAVARLRKHRYHQIWSGDVEELVDAIMRATMDPMDVEARAIVEDYEQGNQIKEMLEKVAETLELFYDIQVDMQEPEFKLQMKQLVRRVITCGVAFAKPTFVRESEELPLASTQQGDVSTRTKLLTARLSQLMNGDFDADDPKAEEAQRLAASLEQQPWQYKPTTEERLVIDFPTSDSIIVDPRCRLLRGFVGARWVAQKFVLPIDEVNSYFGLVLEKRDFKAEELETRMVSDEVLEELFDVVVYELWDKTTRTVAYAAKGYSDWLKAPEAVYPSLRRFWPYVTLAFNDVEMTSVAPSLIYPPSDVELMKSPQREWNRTRNSLKLHRTANRPKYISTVPLTEEDKLRIQYADEQAVIELLGLPAGTDASKVLVALETKPIDPLLYNTDPLQQDMLMAVGMSSENMGPIQPNGTATQATISEQSRLAQTSSNADDVDDFLSDLAKLSGELLLLEASEETVKALVGPGAVWPPLADRAVFASEVFLEIEAASSGRPNKSLEVANFERMAPLLLQAGANPRFLVEEGIKRLDDQLDTQRAFPLGVPQGPMPQQEGQPLQTMPNDVAIPLAGQQTQR